MRFLPQVLALMALVAPLRLASAAADPIKAEDMPAPSSEVSAALTMLKEENMTGAHDAFKALAAKGDANAHFAYGVILQEAIGTARDYAGAERQYRAGAAKGHVACLSALGKMLTMNGLPTAVLREGQGHLEKAISGGSKAAHMHLADFIIRNPKADPESRKADLKKALDLLEKAATSLPEAKYKQGLLIDEGFLGPDPDGKGFKLLEEAAAAGVVDASLQLARKYVDGIGVKADPAKGRELFEQAVKTHRASEAQYQLGRIYQLGRGVTVDNDRAVFYYRQAAEANHAEANLQLGTCLDKGIGIERDQAAAFKHFVTSAQAGSALGMFNVAVYHELGHGGIKMDQTEACRWYLQAAEAGAPLAMNEIGMRYKLGKGVMQDYTAAVAWLDKCVVLHAFPSAQINLGLMFENGHGVLQSYERAGELYTLAAQAGRSEAKYALATLFANGLGTTKNLINAYILHTEADAAGYVPSGEAKANLEKELTPDQLKQARELMAQAAAKQKAPTPTGNPAEKSATVKKIPTN